MFFFSERICQEGVIYARSRSSDGGVFVVATLYVSNCAGDEADARRHNKVESLTAIEVSDASSTPARRQTTVGPESKMSPLVNSKCQHENEATTRAKGLDCRTIRRATKSLSTRTRRGVQKVQKEGETEGDWSVCGGGGAKHPHSAMLTGLMVFTNSPQARFAAIEQGSYWQSSQSVWQYASVA